MLRHIRLDRAVAGFMRKPAIYSATLAIPAILRPSARIERLCYYPATIPLRNGGLHGGLFSIAREDARRRRRSSHPDRNPGRARNRPIRATRRFQLVGVLHALVARAQRRNVD